MGLYRNWAPLGFVVKGKKETKLGESTREDLSTTNGRLAYRETKKERRRVGVPPPCRFDTYPNS